MASSFLVPLHIANRTNTPSGNADSGFVLLYLKDNYLKYKHEGVEKDVVLGRPLDGFALATTASSITQADTVLSGFGKIQKSLLSLTLTGDVTGTAQYQGGNLVIQTTINLLDKTVDITDYDYDIGGVKNGLNQHFTTRFTFIEASPKVYLNGVRLTPGTGYDYEEVGPNIIRIYNTPEVDDLITVDYKITIP